jgi:hypothetical protein
LHEIREMQNKINSLKNENEERMKIMQELLEQRHLLEKQLAAAAAAAANGGGVVTPPVQDRREASLFCTNNKSGPFSSSFFLFFSVGHCVFASGGFFFITPLNPDSTVPVRDDFIFWFPDPTHLLV